MKNLSVNQKTLFIFILSLVVCVPLMIVANYTIDSSVVLTVIISALGWFAGAAIIGTYIYFRPSTL